MNDELRTTAMLVITNSLSLVTAFGLQLSGDQVGAITAFGNSLLLLVMFFWKAGQGRSIRKRLKPVTARRPKTR